MPLHAWRGIAAHGAVLAKPRGYARPTTSAVDTALGFDRFVHCYLARSPEGIADLPILQAQLKPARRPPFPHAVLELETGELGDHECVICNWNLAVSRPGVPGMVRGGNWTRGTKPSRIREVWDAYRATNPSVEKARGIFYPPFAVPVLRGEDIARHLTTLRRAPRRMPELLLRPAIPLNRFSRLIVFSVADAAMVEGLAAQVRVELVEFPGYTSAAVPERLRQELAGYLGDPHAATDVAWDFDAIR